MSQIKQFDYNKKSASFLIVDLSNFCIDCKCFHSQISRVVMRKYKKKKIGEICDDCNNKRISRILDKKRNRNK